MLYLMRPVILPMANYRPAVFASGGGHKFVLNYMQLAINIEATRYLLYKNLICSIRYYDTM
jgi:hypothetical protein